jgi:hypothetical protein
MTDDSELNEILHRAALALPDDPDRLSSVVARRVRRAHHWMAGLAAASVVVVVLGVALVVDPGGSGAASPVAGDRQQYTATGPVVHIPGEPDRACMPSAIAAFGAGGASTATPCPGKRGVEVTGVDFDTLTDRHEYGDGSIEGRATLVGNLRGDVFEVTEQSDPVSAEADRFDGTVTPSCPAPTGGWPQGRYASEHPAWTYRDTHKATIWEVRAFEPVPASVDLYVLTAVDPAPIEAALRPTYGDHLCVRQSRYSSPEGDAARADVEAQFEALGLTEAGGPSINKEGEVEISLSAPRMSDELQALLDRHPKGLITPQLWLHPVSTALLPMETETAPAPTSAPSAGTRGVIAPDGRYTLSGRLVRVPGKPDRACAPLPRPAILITPTPPPTTCETFSIDVNGADFSEAALSNRFEKDGAIEGYVDATGTVKDGVLRITEQKPQATGSPGGSGLTTYCDPPEGGWPKTGPGYNPNGDPVFHYRDTHPRTIAQTAIGRPASDVAIMFVLTYTDPQPVEEALRPAYGKSLCVRQTHFGYDEVSAVESDIKTHAQPYEFYGYPNFGTVGDDGEVSFPIQMTVVTPEIQALMDRHPKGLITADPFLHRSDS